jgi:hypothetical protein
MTIACPPFYAAIFKSEFLTVLRQGQEVALFEKSIYFDNDGQILAISIGMSGGDANLAVEQFKGLGLVEGSGFVVLESGEPLGRGDLPDWLRHVHPAAISAHVNVIPWLERRDQ